MSMVATERFWDGISEKYAAKPVPDADVYRTKLEITRSYLRPDSDVLEFGCGTGSTAIHLAPFVGAIRATDVSAEMIRIAKEKAAAAGLSNLTFEKAVLNDEAPNTSVHDVILGHSILHLLDDWRGAIRRVHGLLKPGGVFISSTACLGGAFLPLWPVLKVGALMGATPTVRFFTVGKLTRAMEDAGFDLERVWCPGGGRGAFIVAVKR